LEKERSNLIIIGLALNGNTIMMDIDQPILKLKNHPFFIGPLDADDKPNIPKSLDFNLMVNSKTGIIVQLITPDILCALENAYNFGSIASTPLGESELATGRMNEFISHFLNLFIGDIKGKAVLEIGCGNGVLLNEIKKLGAKVTGLEIGPQSKEVGIKYGIEIIDKPLDQSLFNKKYDCIFSYGCIEHIPDLIKLFDDIKSILKENGKIIHSVPNSEVLFEQESFSHLIHEHVNYFTNENIKYFLQLQAFNAIKAVNYHAGNTAIIYSGTYNSSNPKINPSNDFLRSQVQKLQKWSDKLMQKKKIIVSNLLKMKEKKLKMGFYAGGYEFISCLNEYPVRFFDGDKYKHNKSWLVGLKPIESPVNIKNNPVDVIVIFEAHHYTAIKKYLQKELEIDEKINIYSIKDLECLFR